MAAGFYLSAWNWDKITQKSEQQILMKFSGAVDNGPRNSLNFGDCLDSGGTLMFQKS